MAQTKKTDNTYFSDKVHLRAAHLPDGPVSVLDCFAGKGLVWRAVRELTGREITTLPIDIRDTGGFRLPGDNRTYLETIDLGRFNVVDIDAYGAPYDQLKIIFDRKYQGVVFVTFTRGKYVSANRSLLVDIGFTRTMIKRCPTLFGKKGWAYFKQCLALRGVRQIYHRSKVSKVDKHYLAFRLGLD